MDRESREGSVLIIVLLVLVGAAYLIMESSKFLRIDYAGAAAQRVTVSGGSLLRSGLNVASELLIEDYRVDEGKGDHQFEEWYAADDFYSRISDSLKSGEIEGRITAEDARFNLNMIGSGGSNEEKEKMIDDVFRRLVDGVKTAHGIELDTQLLINSIKAWRGVAVKGNNDASWYTRQEPPYTIAKGDFRTPHELVLVRWGELSMNKKRTFLYGDGAKPGLIDFITVWGTAGKINMNFASPEIIAATCTSSDTQIREEFVKAMLNKRNNASLNFNGYRWYQDVVGTFQLDNYPFDILTYQSSIFRVDLTAVIGAGQMRTTAILERQKGKQCVVKFENIH